MMDEVHRIEALIKLADKNFQWRKLTEALTIRCRTNVFSRKHLSCLPELAVAPSIRDRTMLD